MDENKNEVVLVALPESAYYLTYVAYYGENLYRKTFFGRDLFPELKAFLEEFPEAKEEILVYGPVQYTTKLIENIKKSELFDSVVKAG